MVAQYIGESAAKKLEPLGWNMRFDTADGDIDKESGFYILKHTVCPWVLTENGFYTNEDECKYMLSIEGVWTFAQIHYDAIVKYLNHKKYNNI